MVSECRGGVCALWAGALTLGDTSSRGLPRPAWGEDPPGSLLPAWVDTRSAMSGSTCFHLQTQREDERREFLAPTVDPRELACARAGFGQTHRSARTAPAPAAPSSTSKSAS